MANADKESLKVIPTFHLLTTAAVKQYNPQAVTGVSRLKKLSLNTKFTHEN